MAPENSALFDRLKASNPQPAAPLEENSPDHGGAGQQSPLGAHGMGSGKVDGVNSPQAAANAALSYASRTASIASPAKPRSPNASDLFGDERTAGSSVSRPPPTSDAQARADAQRVGVISARDPAQGSQLLAESLSGSDDASYRSELVRNSGGAVENMGRTLTSAQEAVRPDANVRASETVSNLADASRSAGRAGRDIAHRFADGMPATLAPGSAKRIFTPLDSVARRGGSGARFATHVVEGLRQSGRTGTLQQLAAHSPALATVAGPAQGEQAAQAQVRVNSDDVVKEKKDLLAQGDSAAQDAHSRADALFAQAGKKDFVKKGDTLEHQIKDAQGVVIGLETARRSGEDVEVSTTQLDHGVATRQSEGVVEGKRFTRSEQFKADGKPGQLPSPEDVKSRAKHDPDVTVNEQSVATEGEHTVARSFSADAENGVNETTRRYREQTNRMGIHGSLADKLADGKPIQVVETESAVTPRGKDAKTQSTHSTQYSQGNTRVTSTEGKDAKGEPLARQWSLEIQKGRAYDRQEFAEGNPDYTSVTHREADRDSVRESVKTQFKKGDAVVHTSGESTRTFGEDGGVAALHQVDTDGDGAKTTQDYHRTLRDTEQGTVMSETARTAREDAKGVRVSHEQKSNSQLTDEGPQLLSNTETLASPDGTSTTVADANGVRTQVDGKPLRDNDDFKALSVGSQQVALTNIRGVNRSVRDNLSFASKSTKALNVSSGLKVDGSNGIARAAQKFSDKVKTSSQDLVRAGNANAPMNIAGGGVRSLAGLAGVYIGTKSLMQDLRHFNGLNAVGDGLITGISAANTYKGAKLAMDGIKAFHTVLPAEVALANGELAGKLGAKAEICKPLVIAGAAFGGIQALEGIRDKDGWKVAQGGVTMASAIGGGAAAGAIGGVPGVLAGIGIGIGSLVVVKMLHSFDHADEAVAKVQI